MAAIPVFVADNTTLLSKLRLSSLQTTSDAYEIYEEALLETRVGFIRRLGNSRVATIQGYSFSETPTTENENIRLIANVSEVKWVRSVLMRTLSTRFLDSSGGELHDMQLEAAFRSTGGFEREQELKRLKEELEQMLQLLEGHESVAAETTYHITTLEPNTTDNTLIRPGESVFDYGT